MDQLLQVTAGINPCSHTELNDLQYMIWVQLLYMHAVTT